MGFFSRKICCLPWIVRLVMPLSPLSISPGHGLPGADLPHIGEKYSLDFSSRKVDKSAARASLNKVHEFLNS
jgi:hypothetical protein